MKISERPSLNEHGLGPAAITLGQETLELLGVDSDDEIQELGPWYRGGAETFVTDFWRRSDGLPPAHLIAKACVKFCARETMADWFERRKTLIENGVDFPNVYALHSEGAMWVEEFIPYSFREAHKMANDSDRKLLEESLLDTYLRIEGAGFRPLSLHDLRSRGSDVVMIDVGEDVGGKRDISQCEVSARQRAMQHLSKAIKG